MAFFLVLRIGAILYAGFIIFWEWGFARGSRSWRRRTTKPFSTTRSSTAIGNSLYYTGVGAAHHGARAPPRRRREPEDPRPDLLPRGVLLPGHRQLRGDHVLWRFIFSGRGLFNACVQPRPESAVRGARLQPDPQRIGTSNTAMNTVIALTSGRTLARSCCSTWVPQTISKDIYEAAAIDGAGAWTRSGGSRSRCSALPLFRCDRGGHRRPSDVRQAYIGGGPMEPEQCPDHDRAVPLSLGDRRLRFGLRRRRVVLFAIISPRPSSSGGCSADPTWY